MTLQGVTYHVSHIRPSVRASARVAVREWVEGFASALIPKSFNNSVNAGYNVTPIAYTVHACPQISQVELAKYLSERKVEETLWR
jgi:hypothetical protein